MLRFLLQATRKNKIITTKTIYAQKLGGKVKEARSFSISNVVSYDL